MINPKELRIGNIIQRNPEINWVGGNGYLTETVESISSDGINFSCYPESGIHWDSLDRFVGIPLTEDWLLRFGFAVNPIKKDIFDKGIWFVYDKGFWVDCEGGTRISNCEYVHQLQNIYFSLTGQEIL